MSGINGEEVGRLLDEDLSFVHTYNGFKMGYNEAETASSH